MSHLFVFFTASPRAGQWRTAIAQAGQVQGWQVIEDDGILDPEALLSSVSPTVVLSSLATPSPLMKAGFATVVVHDTPAAAMALALDGSRRSLADMAFYASGSYAAASELAGDGALVVDASAALLRLPGLGDVNREPSPPIPNNDWRALDVYETLPPPIGAVAAWPLAALNYLAPSLQGPVETGDPRIDLTGRARNLIYGPYTYLPSGNWQVNAQVMIDPEGGAAHLRLEWGSNSDHVFMQPTVNSSGVYGVQLQHVWPAPASAEFRVTTTQPHFHGRLELLSISVRRLPDEPPVGDIGLD